MGAEQQAPIQLPAGSSSMRYDPVTDESPGPMAYVGLQSRTTSASSAPPNPVSAAGIDVKPLVLAGIVVIVAAGISIGHPVIGLLIGGTGLYAILKSVQDQIWTQP